MESEWRLDRWLAKAGVGSRKDVKKLLKKKRVKQNGQVVTDASAKVHIEQDTITLDGNPITANTGPIYLLMNKQKKSRECDDRRGECDRTSRCGRTVSCGFISSRKAR